MRVGKTVQGATRLGFDAVEGVTNIVEGMYRNIAATPLPFGQAPEGRAPGIAGIVHETIRQVNGGLRSGVDIALGTLTDYLDHEVPDGFASDAFISALNGLVGDHLEESNNPLAIPMSLNFDQAAAAQNTGGELLIMMHGLAMHDSFFTWKQHNHGKALAEAFNLTPVWLRYNSGRHISQNGAELAERLEQLIEDWPQPVKSIRIIGYSMGGLVARSAMHAAEKRNLRWPQLTQQAFYLGSPHHGSAVERGGNWFQTMFTISPYSAPLAALGMVRSAGITDLRHGNVVDDDWQHDDRFAHHEDRRQNTALPDNIEHYAIAASLSASPKTGQASFLLSDGLVHPRSAFGQHKIAVRDLGIPVEHQRLLYDAGHLDLLADQRAYVQLTEWLQQANRN